MEIILLVIPIFAALRCAQMLETILVYDNILLHCPLYEIRGLSLCFSFLD